MGYIGRSGPRKGAADAIGESLLMSSPQAEPVYKSLSVRTFRPEDQDAVSRLYTEGLLVGQIAPNDTGADLDNLHEAYFDEPRHHFWVAEFAGQVVGMIGVGSDEAHTAEIRRLRVSPSHQHHSPVADRLLDVALQHCRNHAYLKVRLDTYFERCAAFEHFEKAGFQHTNTRTAPGARELHEFYLDLYRQPGDEG